MYFERGIKVCERWQSYENFLADMGRRPSPDHSLDRIDNDGDYCPENCRWATRKEQNRNTSRTIFLTIHGERKSLRDWCDAVGENYWRVHGRLVRGWDQYAALSLPCGATLAEAIAAPKEPTP